MEPDTPSIEDELLLKQGLATFEQYARRAETTIFESHHDRSRIRVLILDRPIKDDKCAALPSTSCSHDEDTTSIGAPYLEGSLKDKVDFEEISNDWHGVETDSEMDNKLDEENDDMLPEYTPGLHAQTVRDDEELKSLIKRTQNCLRVL